MKKFDELSRLEAQVLSKDKAHAQRKSTALIMLIVAIALIGIALVAVIIKVAFFPSTQRSENILEGKPSATVSVAEATNIPEATGHPISTVAYAVVTAIPTAQPTATPDPVDTVLIRVDPDDGMVFGGYLSRQSVKKITFEDAFTNIPSNAWDISASQNGSIMAWVEKTGKYYNLHIGSKSVVIADEDCSGLFQGYTNLTSVEFGVYFDTSNVKDMSYMFKDCAKLKKVDLSTLNLDKVRNFDGMFEGCEKLSELNVGSLNMNKLEKAGAFEGCESLSQINE